MTSVIEITGSNIKLWKIFMRNLIIFLKMYRKLLDAYVLDFYAKDLWGSINLKWRETLENLKPADLSNFLNKKIGISLKKIPPLSLLAFRATCFCFSLPRDSIENVNNINFFLNKKCVRSTLVNNPEECSLLKDNLKECSLLKDNHEECNLLKGNLKECSLLKENLQECSLHKNFSNLHLLSPLKSGTRWQKAETELSPEGGQHCLLQHVFRKHLKPKKQHEVVRMAQLTSLTVKSSLAKVIVDVGSGQGHLSRLISYGFEIPSICLDAEKNFVQGARKFDLQLEESLKRQHKDKEYLKLPSGPRHDIFHLHPNILENEFSKMLKRVWPELSETEDVVTHKSTIDTPFGLIGLHSCGDLGPTLLKLFCSTPSCVTVISVGCCYMKLSTESENENFEGYPLSNFLKKSVHHQLSYNAREVACHALEAYLIKLKSGADNLKVHCYRAVLEELIIKRRPDLKHAGLRSVKNAHLQSFLEYAQIAISRVEGIHFKPEELDTEDIRRKLLRWMQVVTFYSLRLMLAPAVESLIMLDRLIFLNERDVRCILAPIFDPTISPRNYSIIALK